MYSCFSYILHLFSVWLANFLAILGELIGNTGCVDHPSTTEGKLWFRMISDSRPDSMVIVYSYEYLPG
jgi:hypothetical protein